MQSSYTRQGQSTKKWNGTRRVVIQNNNFFETFPKLHFNMSALCKTRQAFFKKISQTSWENLSKVKSIQAGGIKNFGLAPVVYILNWNVTDLRTGDLNRKGLKRFSFDILIIDKVIEIYSTQIRLSMRQYGLLCNEGIQNFLERRTKGLYCHWTNAKKRKGAPLWQHDLWASNNWKSLLNRFWFQENV